MPWFWSGKQQPAQFDNVTGADPNGNTAGQQSGDQQLTKAEKKAMEAYRFDSSALERAAEAAKTLERSSNDVTFQF
jgi:ATPase family AAA domain-containing protein 3A/B